MLTSINRSMLAAFSALAILVIVSGGASVWSGNEQKKALDRMQEASALLRNHMNADMMHDAVRADVLSILASAQHPELGLAASRQRLDADTAELRKSIARDRAYRGSDAVVASAASIDDQVQRYITSGKKIAAVATGGATADSYLPHFLKDFEQLEGGMSKVSDTIEAHLAQVNTDADHLANISDILIIVGSTAMFIMIVTIGILCRRFIVVPLVSLVEVLRRMTSGDLNVTVPSVSRRDEIGQVATATLTFRDQLAAADKAKAEQTTLIVDSIGTALSKLAEGDLVARVDTDLVGPFAKLKTDFNTASSSLQSTLAQVSQTISGINNGAGDISQASDDLSQRTEQQAASLEQTAAAMEEITSTVRETAAHASKANEAVRAARQQADHSGEVVGTAIQAMGEIERTSNEISEIITVIDGIAFQTNLLALNAGVEAARAGDAGKGFAVVASEVRALAQRTAEAAKDVKARITASGEQVKSGVQLVGQAGSSLQQIMERIAEVDQLMNSIATATEQQATGLQQVNTAVSEMDSVTQQNAAMVEESTAAARSLASDADELTRQISRFQTGQAPAAAPVRSAPVHKLQARAAQAGRKIAQAMRRSGSAAVAVQEDWSEF